MDPVERLRSVFYISNEDHSPEAFTAYLEAQHELVNSTHDTEMPLGKGCCEYNYYLGGGDVKTAKQVLVSQFDFVGISEMMSETLVCLARLYGKKPAGMGTLARDAGLEEPKTEKWKKGDLEMATAITAKDQEIYDFAKELFERQSVSMWNNKDVLKAQTKNLEEAWNKKWEPEWDSACAVVEPLAETHVDGDSEPCQLDIFVHDRHSDYQFFPEVQLGCFSKLESEVFKPIHVWLRHEKGCSTFHTQLARFALKGPVSSRYHYQNPGRLGYVGDYITVPSYVGIITNNKPS